MRYVNINVYIYKKNNKMEKYVNHVMDTINLYSDNIYESLMDNDTEELNKNILLLINLLKDIQHKEEI